MVRDERANNFISCLHQGEVTIFPWPVIGSEPFYEEFAELKDRLDSQAVTYPSAGQFLQVLKMLMAKIKVKPSAWVITSLNPAPFFLNRNLIGPLSLV